MRTPKNETMALTIPVMIAPIPRITAMIPARGLAMSGELVRERPRTGPDGLEHALYTTDDGTHVVWLLIEFGVIRWVLL